MKQSPKIFSFDFKDLNISSKILEELMGYNNQQDSIGPVSEAISEVLNIAQSLCNIKGGYVIVESIKIDNESKQIYSHGQCFDTKQIVTHQLRRSEQAAWFVCTAGDKLSKYSRKMMDESDLIKGYVADVLANLVLEATMDKIQENLQSEMFKKGLKITNRYSPGYCDWDITEQRKLFKVFPKNFLNISLTDSCLMIPIKSISGIIGIGKNVKFNQYTCNLCSDVTCIYRNKKKER